MEVPRRKRTTAKTTNIFNQSSSPAKLCTFYKKYRAYYTRDELTCCPTARRRAGAGDQRKLKMLRA
jgi:hypothetical protein